MKGAKVQDAIGDVERQSELLKDKVSSYVTGRFLNEKQKIPN
jgi:hypothetical protein